MCTSSGSTRADRPDLARLRDGQLGGGGHRRIEVARRAPVPQVPELVGTGGVDEANVGPQRLLEDVLHAAELTLLLPFGEQRARRDRRVEAADPRPARTDRLGERALRQELVLDLTRVDRARRAPDSR